MTPAEMLEKMSLERGWVVVEKLTRSPNATGGFFSTGYRVRHQDGREGFLKAMDYSRAFEEDDIAMVNRQLNRLTSDFEFEKEICERCTGAYLKRVVHAIDSGSVRTNSEDKHSIVNYLIFELADGDVRAHLDAQAEFDVAFAVRSLHHVACALGQLHRTDIAHQDLKPSNVLVFSGTKESKLGDLGRAWSKDVRAPHDHLPIAGAKPYAPPEFLYREVPADEARRRFGCDLYHLGSLIYFVFTKCQMNAEIKKHLAPEHWWGRWGGPFGEVLPYVLAAFSRAVADFEDVVPDYLKPKLVEILKHLCDPDPLRRGHPLNRYEGGAQHSLERYLSALDHLAYLAESRLSKRGEV